MSKDGRTDGWTDGRQYLINLFKRDDKKQPFLHSTHTRTHPESQIDTQPPPPPCYNKSKKVKLLECEKEKKTTSLDTRD